MCEASARTRGSPSASGTKPRKRGGSALQPGASAAGAIGERRASHLGSRTEHRHHPFLADHQVQGSTLVPGAVFIEMALAAAKATYGSTNHSVDKPGASSRTHPRRRLRSHSPDHTQPGHRHPRIRRVHATADGDLKWTITATAELNTLPRSPECGDTLVVAPKTASPLLTATSSTPAPEPSDSHYGDAFQARQHHVPEMAGRERNSPFPAQDRRRTRRATDSIRRSSTAPSKHCSVRPSSKRRETRALPSHPIRHSAVYRPPEENMTAHRPCRVGDQRRDRKRHHDHQRRRRAARRLQRLHRAITQRLIGACRPNANRQGPLRDSMGRRHRHPQRPAPNATSTDSCPGSSSSTPPASGQRSQGNCTAAATASTRSYTNR
jgi:hypothetical protein